VSKGGIRRLRALCVGFEWRSGVLPAGKTASRGHGQNERRRVLSCGKIPPSPQIMI